MSGRGLEYGCQLDISMAMTTPCLVRQSGESLGDKSLKGKYYKRMEGPRYGGVFQWL